MLAVDLTPLAPGLHELALHPEPHELDVSDETFEQIAVKLSVDYQTDRVFLRLAIEAEALLVCDRTLVPYRQRLSGSHRVLFLLPERVPEPADDDVRPLPQPGVPLDLTDVVRDTLLLALPVRRVAPGADDQPLDLVFGDEAEDVADPRWEALGALRRPS